MAKKTFSVRALVDSANEKLANPLITQEAKRTLFYFVSDVLHETGNYAGFGYLVWANDGYQRWKDAGEPEDKAPFLGPEYDRFLYISKHLK